MECKACGSKRKSIKEGKCPHCGNYIGAFCKNGFLFMVNNWENIEVIKLKDIKGFSIDGQEEEEKLGIAINLEDNNVYTPNIFETPEIAMDFIITITNEMNKER